MDAGGRPNAPALNRASQATIDDEAKLEAQLKATPLLKPPKEPDEVVTKFVEVKDLYGTLVATRNLEIGLFWQRSNYFLVLNTGIALGFFNLKGGKYAPIFAVIGLFSSGLWFWVSLGSKYWQTRWEQRLMDFERDRLNGLAFFSASPARINSDVERGMSFRTYRGLKKWVYKLALVTHPSVSFSMILLATLFFAGWVAVAIVFSRLT